VKIDGGAENGIVLNSLEAVLDYLKRAKGWGVNYIPATEAVKVTPGDSDKEAMLNNLRSKEIGDCRLCSLEAARKNLVFGQGNPEALLMFVGEAPGRDEDLKGVPFIGTAGQLLTKIIESIKLKRENVYIANVLKCRPPNNRDPEPGEVEKCRFILERQIEIIKPRIICALGKFAAQWFLGPDISISKVRGRFIEWKGILLMPTYHPSFLLRNPAMKRPVWEDMKAIRAEYDKILLTPGSIK
jgi:uracil-DNA glycosylase